MEVDTDVFSLAQAKVRKRQFTGSVGFQMDKVRHIEDERSGRSATDRHSKGTDKLWTGQVTTAFSVLGDQLERRVQNTKELLGDQVIGAVTDRDLLSVLKGEFLFCQVGHPERGVFTAFNGLDISSYSTQFDLERAIKFIGVAETPQYFGPHGEMIRQATGITGSVRGMRTMLNTGRYIIRPGEQFVVTPPLKNTAERTLEQSVSIKPAAVPNGKQLGVPRPVSKLLENTDETAAKARLLSNHQQKNAKCATLSPMDPNVSLDPLERYALLDYQLLPLMNFFEIYTMLVQLGICPPPNVPTMLSPQYVDGLKKQVEMTTFDSHKSTLKDDGTAQAVADEARTEQRKKLVMLANMLGLCPGYNRVEQQPLVLKLVNQLADLTSEQYRLTRLDGQGTKGEQLVAVDKAEFTLPGQTLERTRQNMMTLLRMGRRAFETAQIPGTVMTCYRQADVGSTFEGLM